jgi:protein-disulfide isomerase
MAAFSVCLADEATTRRIDADTRAAAELNITGTPTLLINGRPHFGVMPLEQLETIIAEELHHSTPDRD